MQISSNCCSKRHISSRTSNANYQIDILILDLNIGFEYNGSYHHSYPKKDKDYHKYKTEKALEKRIKLYHIWQYEDLEITKNRIKSIIHGEKVSIHFEEENLIRVNRDWCPSFEDSIFHNRYKFLAYKEPICYKFGRFNYFNSGEVLFKK